jgi:hypothetical protein
MRVAGPAANDRTGMSGEVSWLYAGIDALKGTLAVAVVDEQGRQVAG